MLNQPKGVAANESYAGADDHMTRTYVMPLLFDDQSRRRLIAEHKASPVGTAPAASKQGVEHSQDLRTILDKMRRHPMAGKYVTVCVRMFAEYKIGRVTGVRGEPVEIFDGVFSSEEACEHAIFLMRINDLMRKYG